MKCTTKLVQHSFKFFSMAAKSHASQPVLLIVLSTKTALIKFTQLNPSEIGSTSSPRTTLVRPILGITMWPRYQLTVSIANESQVVFCPFGHLNYFSQFFTSAALYCKVSFVIKSAINTNADVMYIALNMLPMGV